MAVGGSQIRCRKFGSAEALSWVFARSQHVPWQYLFLLGFGGGGWGGERALASAFVPHQTELCRQGAHSDGCFARCKQVPWQEPVPFGILAGGMGEGDGTGERLCSPPS